MKQILLMIAVVVVGCGGGKQEEAQGPSQSEPTIPPQATLPTEPQPTPKETVEKPKPPKVIPTATAIELTIRKFAGKRTGELTKEDLERVTRLDLAGGGFANKGRPGLTEVPKELEKLTRLRVLGLDRNQLTNVKSLEKCTQLTMLGLSRNQLTDVKSLEKLAQLKVLDLSGNQLTNVKGLEKLTKLEELHLSNNPALTKVQIAELQKVLPKCKISSNPTK